jgi:transposase InsO family protein
LKLKGRPCFLFQLDTIVIYWNSLKRYILTAVDHATKLGYARELNPELTEWLIEYNFNRPHQSLGYLAPVEYIERELAKVHNLVLPMWSASTRYCFSSIHSL